MSYRSSDPFQQIRGSITRAGVPITIGVIVANVLTFLIDSLGHGIAAFYLACQLYDKDLHPIWSPLTYALDTQGYIGVVLGCLWLWSVGSSLERSWGSQRFGGFFLATSLVTALCVWAGTSLLHTAYGLLGLWIPLSALTVAWVAMNPRQTISAYMVLQFPAWVFGAFVVGMVYFIDFEGKPLLGLFGLVPSAAAYFYVNGGFTTGSPYRGYARRGPDLKMTGNRPASMDRGAQGWSPLSSFKAWQERRRLQKLWKDSGFKDNDPRR